MWEWINIIGSVAAFLLYEVYARIDARRSPLTAARSAHAAIRSNWVKSVMSRSGTEILVIQTLRNSVMAASLMATTAVLALSATLSLGGIGNVDHGLFRAGGGDALVFTVKFLLLAVTFFISFLLLAMAVRYFNHTGYLITGETGSEEFDRKLTLAIAYLNRAGRYYSLGLRAFFACIPFLAGLFNTCLMLPASLLLLLLLYWVDRVPTPAT